VETGFSDRGRPLLPRVVAHRGASRAAPENTLAAFRMARSLGARAVECDVRLTADAVCVVIHDPDTRRTTGHPGLLSRYTAGEIAALEAGGDADGRFAGEGIPTLREALELFHAEGLAANLEIKADVGGERRIAEALAATLAECPETSRTVSVISSFSIATLRASRELLPSVPRGLLVAGLPRDWRGLVEKTAARAVHCRHDRIHCETVARLHEAGLDVVAYTVDDPDTARRLLAMGVDSLITNVPDALLPLTGNE